MNKSTTILMVNFNSSDFVNISLYSLLKLTKNPHKVFIVDNGSRQEDYEKLKNYCSQYNNVHIERWETDLRGGVAHGTALNHLVKKVDTPYFSVLDADALWLIKDWDEILINEITNSNYKVIGTQGPVIKSRDFPLMFAILFETETFNKLNIDFRPKDVKLLQDTGWEIREKYLENGFQGKIIPDFSTRTFKEGPFNKLIVVEYYLKDYKNIFASHFARGSSLGANKYGKSSLHRITGKIPYLGKYLLKQKGIKEKNEWIRICKEIIDNQYYIGNKKFEKLNSCPYCNSKSIKLLFTAPERLENLPGTFYLSECRECTLVFQNPRVKQEFIGEFYINELGYYQPETRDKALNTFNKINKWLYKQILINHFNYHNLGNKSLFLKILVNPLAPKARQMLTPSFVDNGKLLDVGCAHGQLLNRFKGYGWKNLYEIELNEKAGAHAKSQGYTVECKGVEEVNFDDNFFDTITLGMVLEHLYDPFEKLRTISRWLKPQGELIFSIPYFKGVEFKLLKEFSYPLQLPHHITFFNKKIIKEYLSELGYTTIRFKFGYSDKDIRVSSKFKYEETNKWIYKILSQNIIARKIIREVLFVLSWFGKTSRLVVYAKKG